MVQLTSPSRCVSANALCRALNLSDAVVEAGRGHWVREICVVALADLASPRGDTMAYAGFDSLEYPGDRVMRSIKDTTNFKFAGFYLAPAPSRPNSNWMGKRDVLVRQGWGLVPIYVGQQELGQPGSHNLTPEQGQLDGLDAGNLMSRAGFPANSIIYLDIEQGGPASNATLLYFGAWVDRVRLSPNQYLPGVYCSYTTAPSLLAIRPDVYVWAWRLTNDHDGPTYPTPDPSGSRVPQARVWQYFQNTNMRFPGAPDRNLKIDLDSASVQDPSHPGGLVPALRRVRRRRVKVAAKKKKRQTSKVTPSTASRAKKRKTAKKQGGRKSRAARRK